MTMSISSKGMPSRFSHIHRVNRTVLKKYNAGIHSQSVLETVLELQRQTGFEAAAIVRIEIEVFDVAYNIIGGGEEGSKMLVRTKEEADHSLPYMVAAAILDGRVMPQQYLPEQIGREAVQTLLRKVTVRPNQAYSDRFPEEMPCRVTIRLQDGRVLEKEGHDYEGFHTRPFSWETALGKFQRLSEPYASPAFRRKISEAVRNLENIKIGDLMKLLAKVKTPVARLAETAGNGNQSKS